MDVIKNLFASVGRWLWPFVAAILMVLAVNKARSKRQKVDRAMARIEQDTEFDIGDQSAQVGKDIDNHIAAQKAAKKAKDNAKKRIAALADSKADMADMLHDYRRRLRADDPDAT